ncbi:hypothetical protein LTR08_003494 [Meristemomyces frigidus]|nr:hypothetical protein LTR08_003494 [Meristemomyces frigidus]
MTYLQKFRSSKLNLWLQRVLRVLEFLSPVISLGFFASRLYKIHQLQHRLSTSNGAVAGILAAAIVYSLAALLVSLCIKAGPKWLRWLLMVLDLCFVGAFIAVAYLTRPHGGSSGPCRSNQYQKEVGTVTVSPKGQNCNLPWASFISAIISAILHFLTALFHEIKDHRNKKNAEKGYGNAPGNEYGNGAGNGN